MTSGPSARRRSPPPTNARHEPASACRPRRAWACANGVRGTRFSLSGSGGISAGFSFAMMMM